MTIDRIIASIYTFHVQLVIIHYLEWWINDINMIWNHGFGAQLSGFAVNLFDQAWNHRISDHILVEFSSSCMSSSAIGSTTSIYGWLRNIQQGSSPAKLQQKMTEDGKLKIRPNKSWLGKSLTMPLPISIQPHTLPLSFFFPLIIPILYQCRSKHPTWTKFQVHKLSHPIGVTQSGIHDNISFFFHF